MFITDQLIYIQMQKTGCTHIAMLLSQLFDGEQIGKHNAASAEQIDSNAYFVSSIRNPWDWYLSLWTYGAQGCGGLLERLTERNYRNVWRLFPKHPLRGYAAFIHEAKKNVSQWREVYNDSTSAASFRKWLQLIHAPENACWLGEGYEASSITAFCGFMSYRYLYLCCSEPWKLNNTELVSNYTDLVQHERESCYIDVFIHQESLACDLIKAVEKIRPLSEDEKDIIRFSKKTNSSKRSLSVTDYYDEESIELILRREKLLIEKFNYAPP